MRASCDTRRSLVFGIALAFVCVDCRCRTKYEPRVTEACRAFAAETLASKRRDGEAYDLLEDKRLCEACCNDGGFDAVDPGPCECGKLGVDVLLK